jgi:hypothetical protein
MSRSTVGIDSRKATDTLDTHRRASSKIKVLCCYSLFTRGHTFYFITVICCLQNPERRENKSTSKVSGGCAPYCLFYHRAVKSLSVDSSSFPAVTKIPAGFGQSTGDLKIACRLKGILL